ncbi:DUF6241 domain-containing protein [Neobacillus jeddahensis]|uniref:DUF6241 domain-containing protein n=1 Tax=Neobacillus jeddahensis TaxID=1461580 RepID=UPI00058E6A8D|nr:DUF6241 domain-containing protein [Neobacillus jeddahensis]
MKRTITYVIFSLVILSLVIFVVVSTSAKSKADTKVQDSKVSQQYIVSKEELKKAEKAIGAIKDEKSLNLKMMEMAFQKVSFKGEDNFNVPGTIVLERIQVTKENIQYLKNNLSVVSGEKKQQYESILNKWYNGNFNSITDDFRNIRILLLGKENMNMSSDIMNPTKKTSIDEKTYILKFFGQNGLNLNNLEWK